MRRSNVEIYRLKAVLLLVALLATVAASPDVQADEVLVYQDENMEIGLQGDVCSPAHPTSRIAYAKEVNGDDIATGCWYKGKMNTYVILIDRGNGMQEEYQLYREKFKVKAAE